MARRVVRDCECRRLRTDAERLGGELVSQAVRLARPEEGVREAAHVLLVLHHSSLRRRRRVPDGGLPHEEPRHRPRRAHQHPASQSGECDDATTPRVTSGGGGMEGETCCSRCDIYGVN